MLKKAPYKAGSFFGKTPLLQKVPTDKVVERKNPPTDKVVEKKEKQAKSLQKRLAPRSWKHIAIESAKKGRQQSKKTWKNSNKGKLKLFRLMAFGSKSADNQKDWRR